MPVLPTTPPACARLGRRHLAALAGLGLLAPRIAAAETLQLTAADGSGSRPRRPQPEATVAALSCCST